MKLIELTNGKLAIVDDADYPFLSAYKWCAYISHRKRIWYASSSIKGKTTIMSRFIMGYPKGLTVDHINGNGLDNRRCNLRLATQSQNAKNRRKNYNSRSLYKGVTFHTQRNRWLARIQNNKRKVSLGLYGSQEEAARAYDAAAKELHGDFAKLNFCS